MLDTIRIWDYVEGIESQVEWRPREKGSNDFVLRRWRGRSGIVRVFAVQLADGKVIVSGESSLPRLVRGNNADQLSPEEIEEACQALTAHIVSALPALSRAGPRRWKISRLDLSQDVTLPEGETARDVVRRLARSLAERPSRAWLPMFRLDDPTWNTLRLVRRNRYGNRAKRQGVAIIAYDKGGQNGLPSTRKLRIEARLRRKPLKDLVDGEFLLNLLPGYLARHGLGALQEWWDKAIRLRATTALGPALAKAIRVPRFPDRALVANRRWMDQVKRATLGRERRG